MHSTPPYATVLAEPFTHDDSRQLTPTVSQPPMAPQQRRLLHNPASKLGKADIVTVLRKEDAWLTLPLETRQQLYTLLPPPQEGEAEHDPDVHPLKSMYKPYIEEELRRWQEDLKDGREAKKWRDEAMQAGRDRVQGKFDEWKEAEREEYWGKSTASGAQAEVQDENVEVEVAEKDREVKDSDEEGGVES